MEFDLFILSAFDPATRFDFFARVLVVVVSIVLHELAHGLEATRLGDPTPRAQGRLNLNPLIHMGPFSLVALALVGIAWGAMPIDPTRLRGKYAEARVAFAGPLVNLVLGVGSLVALGLLVRFQVFSGEPVLTGDRTVMSNLFQLLWIAGFVNLILFVFNMLPAPPLDGSHILANFSRGYARFIDDPSKQGVYMMMFFGAFVVLTALMPRIAELSAWIMRTAMTVGT